MKRLFITFSLVLLASSLMYAQVGLGIKAGANFNTLDGSGFDGFEPDFSNKTGFHGGVYLHYFFSEAVAIQPEVLFSQKGTKVSDIDFTGENTLNYIDIPILLRVQFLKILNIHAGPSINVLAGKELTGEDLDDEIKETFLDNLKNTDFSLVFGAGVNLPLRLNVTARYILGLTDINESSTSELKNRTFQLSLGFRIIGDK